MTTLYAANPFSSTSGSSSKDFCDFAENGYESPEIEARKLKPSRKRRVLIDSDSEEGPSSISTPTKKTGAPSLVLAEEAKPRRSSTSTLHPETKRARKSLDFENANDLTRVPSPLAAPASTTSVAAPAPAPTPTVSFTYREVAFDDADWLPHSSTNAATAKNKAHQRQREELMNLFYVEQMRAFTQFRERATQIRSTCGLPKKTSAQWQALRELERSFADQMVELCTDQRLRASALFSRHKAAVGDAAVPVDVEPHFRFVLSS